MYDQLNKHAKLEGVRKQTASTLWPFQNTSQSFLVGVADR